MQVRNYADLTAYLSHTRPCLEQREAVNNLLLGLALQLSRQAGAIPVPPYLGTVDDEQGEPVLVAFMTPPHGLLLSAIGQAPREAFDRLAENLIQGGWPVSGVNGERQISEQFAQAWSAATGQPATVKMRMRLYTLRQVIPPPHPPAGYLRPAGMADLETATIWRAAFEMESLHQPAPPDLREAMERWIGAGSIFLWDDHGPVSMAGLTRETSHGIAINGVYTPPEFRGRGYASACVAAMSQQMLDRGKSFCALFTDLDYPTSNAIYQQIGYRPESDFLEFSFG
jgi:predicted GNAT family acetyltransferase